MFAWKRSNIHLAKRRLPSMMKAMWRGTCPAPSTFMASLCNSRISIFTLSRERNHTFEQIFYLSEVHLKPWVAALIFDPFPSPLWLSHFFPHSALPPFNQSFASSPTIRFSHIILFFLISEIHAATLLYFHFNIITIFVEEISFGLWIHVNWGDYHFISGPDIIRLDSLNNYGTCFTFSIITPFFLIH